MESFTCQQCNNDLPVKMMMEPEVHTCIACAGYRCESCGVPVHSHVERCRDCTESVTVTLTEEPVKMIKCGDCNAFTMPTSDSGLCFSCEAKRVQAEHQKLFNTDQEPADKNALEQQVGGDHYRGMKIQPIEFIQANNIPFAEGNCIKYLCRHQAKNGAEDVRKVIHYCRLILELVYGESD